MAASQLIRAAAAVCLVLFLLATVYLGPGCWCRSEVAEASMGVALATAEPGFARKPYARPRRRYFA